MKGKPSRPHAVPSGVPQGSVLGPILFLIFINHLGASLTSSYKIFADDLKLYVRSAQHHSYDQSVCQRDVTTLHDVSASWDLRLNQEKCVVIRFQRVPHPPPTYHIREVPIRVTDSHPDLGVIVDSSLKFHVHVSSTVNKAAGLSLNLLRSTVCRSPEFMLALFRTHIRPIIEYCSCVWHTGYLGDLRALEAVQRRWTKRISGMSGLEYECRLRSLNMYSVQGRLLRADMIQCWKVFHGKCSVSPTDVFLLAPQSGTRGHRFSSPFVHCH